MIKLMIVDDQPLMRDGLKTILELEDDLEVIDVCENGLNASESCKTNPPDVILMDIRMPQMNGVEATKIIKENNPDIKIIMLTTFNDDEYIVDALSYGASGYLLKDIPTDKLIDAIKDAHLGNLMIPSDIAIKLATKIKNQVIQKPKMKDLSEFNLSDREVEVSKLLTMGLKNKEIAAKLFISEGTVKNYISSIYSKLGTSDRAEALLMLRELN